MTEESSARVLPEYPPLRLKRREERRLRAGHLWVFSNEVDTAATPLTAFEPGQTVRIEAHNGRVLGVGYVNPRSLISARLLSRDAGASLDAGLLETRLRRALRLRQRLYPQPWYRLVHGEGDALPGLVVDRYGDVLVAQITTAGMERLRAPLLEALQAVLSPRGILLRNDSPLRALEGLEAEGVEAVGELPDTVQLREGGVAFEVALHGGQKTGWFYDQTDNRARLTRYVAGARVLDVFSYLGGWGLTAARAGADEVLCVDSSEAACNAIAEQAGRNGLAAVVSARQGEAVEVLKALRDARERFDVVVLDPPALIKRRKDLRAGEQAYHRLNQLAAQLLVDDGILVSCSCSHHLPARELDRVVATAAHHAGRELQILERGRQGPDHPVHPAIPETEYLKVVYARLSV